MTPIQTIAIAEHIILTDFTWHRREIQEKKYINQLTSYVKYHLEGSILDLLQVKNGLLFEEVEVRVLVGVVVHDVSDRRVGGGAEEPAGDGRLFHAEDKRFANVVDVHQRHRTQQPLQQAWKHEVGLVPSHRRHDALQRLGDTPEDRVARDKAAGQGDHLERRVLAVVVAQKLLLRQEL